MWRELNAKKVTHQVDFNFIKFQLKSKARESNPNKNQPEKATNIKASLKVTIALRFRLKELYKQDIYLMIPMLKLRKSKYK